MGGYGSGRRPTRPRADEGQRLPVGYLAAQLRRLRAADPPRPGQQLAAAGVVTWTRLGRQTGQAGYTVRLGAEGQAVAELRHSADGPGQPPQLVELVELPANLQGNPGRLVYLVCPSCGARCRALVYVAGQGGRWRWRCRRCWPTTYASSRASDARVSRALADPQAAARLVAEGQRQAPPPGAGAGELARYLARDTLGLLLKLADRLDSYHAGQGRPWSAARRAASTTPAPATGRRA